MHLNPIDPARNVVGFSNAVRCDASTVAKATRIGHQNAAVILDQPFAESVNVEQVVRDAVQQDDSAAIGPRRVYVRGMQGGSVGYRESDVSKLGRIFLRPSFRASSEGIG